MQPTRGVLFAGRQLFSTLIALLRRLPLVRTGDASTQGPSCTLVAFVCPLPLFAVVWHKEP